MSEAAGESVDGKDAAERASGKSGAFGTFDGARRRSGIAGLGVALASAVRSMGGAARGVLRRVKAVGGSVSDRFLAASALALAGISFATLALHLPEKQSGRLDAVERSIAGIETRLGIPSARRAASDPATILVAVQFVTASAERSAPFDTAVAVAITLIGEHPVIGPLLDTLLNDAMEGVPGHYDLRAEYGKKLAELKSQDLLVGTDGAVPAPSFPFSGLFGFGGSAGSNQDGAIIERITSDVEAGDFASAVQFVVKLDGRLREALESWREQASRRAALDATLKELRRAAYLDILETPS